MAHKGYVIERYNSPLLEKPRSYAIYHPDAGATDSHPILFLHGAGQVGDRIAAAAERHGPRRDARRPERTFTTIVPQLPKSLWGNVGWRGFDRDIDAILKDVAQKYHVDDSRPYLTGLSLGALGAWDIGASGLREWSAIASFAGGATKGSDLVKVAAALGRIPVWAFVNLRETKPDLTRGTLASVDALESAGGDVRYTYYHNIWPRHNCWSRAYRGERCASVSAGKPNAPQTVYDWFANAGNP